jgi:hypothetical protein
MSRIGSWLASASADALQFGSSIQCGGSGNRRTPYLSVLSVRSVVKLFLLFLAELLESGIGAQRIPDWIEPKKGRRNERWAVKPAVIGHL